VAISEELRELVVAYGDAKLKQGLSRHPGFVSDPVAAHEESKRTFDKLCYELEELERYATNWHEHRCY